ncbi:MAG TPA: hypothetical protein P5509_05375, partial [Bacteroidales bacterium]|nr:hypothetical protein [Bacteroidales bacterium]
KMNHQKHKIIIESDEIDHLYEFMYKAMKHYPVDEVSFKIKEHRLSISYNHYLSKRILTFVNDNKKEDFKISKEKETSLNEGQKFDANLFWSNWKRQNGAVTELAKKRFEIIQIIMGNKGNKIDQASLENYDLESLENMV